MMRSLLCLAWLAMGLRAGPLTLLPLIGAGGDISSSAYDGTAAQSGVARLIFANGNVCSGAAIAPTVVLTAAHCIQGSATAASAYFTDSEGQDGTFGASSFLVHPLWNGNLETGVDLALVSLTSPLAAWVSIYQLYAGTTDVSLTYQVAGWGAQSSGGLPYGSVAGPGAGLRVGNNTWDSVYVSFDPFILRFDLLLSDFDDPVNASAVPHEVTAAPGDSGAPAFLNGAIAGVTSFSGAVGYTPNGSYGEINGMTRVYSHSAWIQANSALLSLPEPASFGMIGVAVCLIFRFRRLVR